MIIGINWKAEFQSKWLVNLCLSLQMIHLYLFVVNFNNLNYKVQSDSKWESFKCSKKLVMLQIIFSNFENNF